MPSIMNDTELSLLRAAREAEKWITNFVVGAGMQPPSVLANLRTSIFESERGSLGDENGPYRCEVKGCDGLAQWSGWHRNLDPVTGTPSGLVQRRCVCEVHKHLLINQGDGDGDADA